MGETWEEFQASEQRRFDALNTPEFRAWAEAELAGLPCLEVIRYCAMPMGVGCDGRCDLAIGISWCDGRGNPDELNLRREGRTLAEARANPGTSEGGERKPMNPSAFPNRWCVRQCERCRKATYPGFEQRQR